ncbi:MAG: hypothetical protein HY437_01175 [Candidatus Magasanikbacteria bacterium]|nr:hypothetical protein [Candidatus Magasanikbacteria bacterium]
MPEPEQKKPNQEDVGAGKAAEVVGELVETALDIASMVPPETVANVAEAAGEALGSVAEAVGEAAGAIAEGIAEVVSAVADGL